MDFMYIIGISITIVTAYIVIKTFNRKRYPPGPWGLPILGHLPLLGDNPEKKYAQWWKRYGDIVSIRLGSWKAIVINGYDAIKEATDRQDDVFSGRPNFVTQTALREAFDGLEAVSFANFSPKYLQLRKMTATALRNYMSKCEYSPEELFQNEAEKLTEKLLEYSHNEPVSITSDIEIAVESVIYQMLYGRGKEDEIAPHVNLIVETTATFNKFVGSGNIVDVVPWFRYIMKGKVNQFKEAVLATDWLVRDKMKEHKLTFQTDQTRDVLDALCAQAVDLPAVETEDNLSGFHLMYQVAALQGAGFDTSSRTLLYLILYMTAYPKVQQRVQREIDEVLGSSRVVSLKDREQLPYINATIHEVLRATSIVPFALPHFALFHTKLCGYDVDKDTVAILNLHSVANEGQFWGDPETFRPERFIDENGKVDAEKCSHVLSFGAGRRRCVGEQLAKMNIFILFTTLMQRCTFRKVDGCDLDLEPVRSLVYSPKPFRVVIQRR